jgi:hypothetical protein
MPIQISPTNPVVAIAQGADPATPDLVLQAGTVVNAKVIGVLADDLVRIAIANLSLDVMSEVALVPGQNLQLAVSQSDGGIRLSIVGSGAAAGTGTSAGTVAPGPSASNAAPATTASAPLTPTRNQLTPLEQLAVSIASEAAVTRQGSQAPLFANLGAAVNAGNLPAGLQQAVLQVLAQQTALDPDLSGGDIRAAFQKSGLFLEASLASRALPNGGGVPDLKAALIVLRQILASSLAAPPGTADPTPGARAASVSGGEAGPMRIAPAPPLSPEFEAGPEPQAQQQPAGDGGSPDRGQIALPRPAAGGLLRALTGGAALNPLQEAAPEMPPAAPNAPAEKAVPQNARGGDGVSPGNAPPPFRGALPSAQPVASPSIGPNAPLSATARHLLEDTDAAIARQTLLQVASLPERADAVSQRSDPSTLQWNFEIPFAMPQGTAMAQFEISRDGGGNESDSATRIWRARFSLDVEPAGPVHALISFTGEKTSVRMWAERPATAAQLRAGAAELSQALARAELKPGDIVVREGAPPRPVPARAGHFLDRAL